MPRWGPASVQERRSGSAGATGLLAPNPEPPEALEVPMSAVTLRYESRKDSTIINCSIEFFKIEPLSHWYKPRTLLPCALRMGHFAENVDIRGSFCLRPRLLLPSDACLIGTKTSRAKRSKLKPTGTVRTSHTFMAASCRGQNLVWWLERGLRTGIGNRGRGRGYALTHFVP